MVVLNVPICSCNRFEICYEHILLFNNEWNSKKILAGDKVMPDIHLKQLEFTHNSCETCTKIKERIQNFKETGDSRYLYQNKLNKACFKHNIGYGNFKDYLEEKTSDKVLHNQKSILLKIQHMKYIKEALLQCCFATWLADESCSALLLAGTIIWGSHHDQDLNLRWIQWSCAELITTSPCHHNTHGFLTGQWTLFWFQVCCLLTKLSTFKESYDVITN